MRSTQRIGLLLTLVFLLPALFFSVYEMSSLDNDEKMIQEIYKKQLEAILFSVNQYSDDILSGWISRIESGTEEPGDSIPSKIIDLLNLNASLKGVFISDTVDGKPYLRKYSLEEEDFVPWHKIDEGLGKNAEIIKQLISYKKSGFQKVIRLDSAKNPTDANHTLIFVTQSGLQHFNIAGLVIDTELFIESVVGPRLQTIARDQFILTALRKRDNSIAYSTLVAANANTPSVAEALTKDFWIFPDYSLGIRTQGTTLQQLVRERTTINFILLAGMDIILIVGVVLVFRNLKKEVDLAQNKSDFVSNVSHEIRTPLALISMFAETLEMGRVPTEEKKKEYYSIISKEAQRLSNIVNRILNFSQAEAKKKVLHPEILHTDSEIQGILDTYDFHLRNKGFEYTYAGQEDLWIKADREALVESVINLIDNAVKYSEDKKRIEIRAGQEGSFAYIAVKDYGIGISKEDQKHIFDKFYRVSSGNLARSRGTGLGLSLVKQLVEAQQGRIKVFSEPGKGSQFKLYFPKADNLYQP
jgi:two-component system phosphate regulon sensor histidine kinase PhoR